jgi:hypothetical protein
VLGERVVSLVIWIDGVLRLNLSLPAITCSTRFSVLYRAVPNMELVEE